MRTIEFEYTNQDSELIVFLFPNPNETNTLEYHSYFLQGHNFM